MIKRGALLLGVVAALFACGGPSTQPGSPADVPPDQTDGAEDDGAAVARGEAAIQAKDFEQARTVFAEIVQRRPDHPKANHYLGVALEGLGDKAGAEKHYRAAIAAAPTLTDAALNLSALLIDAQRFDEAIVVLEASSKKNPKDPALHTNLAYARMGKNDNEGAIKAFRDALAIVDNADAHLGLADLLIATDKKAEGIDEAKKAVALAPDNPDILAPAADLFRKAGAADLCVDAFDKAIAKQPAAQLYASRGVCKQANRDTAGAKADYEKAIEVDPNFGPAHYLLGRHLLAVDRNRDAAIRAFEACARVAPQSKCQEAADQARKGK